MKIHTIRLPKTEMMLEQKKNLEYAFLHYLA